MEHEVRHKHKFPKTHDCTMGNTTLQHESCKEENEHTCPNNIFELTE
jgi:hypothetical protein